MFSARRKASSSCFWFECLGDSSPVFGPQLECSRDRWYILWYQSIDLAIEQVFRCKLRYLFVVLLFSWKKSKRATWIFTKRKTTPSRAEEACRSGTWFRLSLVKTPVSARSGVTLTFWLVVITDSKQVFLFLQPTLLIIFFGDFARGPLERKRGSERHAWLIPDEILQPETWTNAISNQRLFLAQKELFHHSNQHFRCWQDILILSLHCFSR